MNMETRYVAEFKVGELKGETSTETSEAKSTDTIIKKDNLITTKNIAKGVTLGVASYGVIQMIDTKLQSTANSISGDSVAQRQLDNRQALINEGIGLVGGLGVAGLIGGPVGLAAAGGGLLLSYAKRGFDMSQNNRVFSANARIERVVNQERQNRLVKDKVGFR